MTTEERDALFMENIRLVNWTFKNYFRHRPFRHAGQIADLLQTGYAALLESLETYNPELTKPSTYCGNAIYFAMLNLVEHEGVIRCASSLSSLKTEETKRKLLAAQHPISLSGKTGNEPTRGHLTRHPREPEDPKATARQAQFEEELDQATVAEQATTFLLRVLKPRHQQIVLTYYQLGNLKETGVQFGISRERVRQIVNKALNRMRLELDKLAARLPLQELSQDAR